MLSKPPPPPSSSHQWLSCRPRWLMPLNAAWSGQQETPPPAHLSHPEISWLMPPMEARSADTRDSLPSATTATTADRFRGFHTPDAASQVSLPHFSEAKCTKKGDGRRVNSDGAPLLVLNPPRSRFHTSETPTEIEPPRQGGGRETQRCLDGLLLQPRSPTLATGAAASVDSPTFCALRRLISLESREIN